jgi:predicted nucleic acid-binding protein
MRIFIDTSAFYALLDSDDTNQEAAASAWTSMLSSDNTLITSNYILVETFALLQNRLGIAAARAFQEELVPIVNIEYVNPEVHRSGIAAFLAAARRNLSLVDCVSFEIMRILGVKNAFTFDPHFKQQGFHTIP